MNIFLVNFKTPDITLMVSLKFESITFSLIEVSGKFGFLVFISGSLW